MNKDAFLRVFFFWKVGRNAARAGVAAKSRGDRHPYKIITSPMEWGAAPPVP